MSPEKPESPYQRNKPLSREEAYDSDEIELANLIFGCPPNCRLRHTHETGCVGEPLKFAMIAFPWGMPGPLERYEGPISWQKEFLIELGEEIRKRKFNGFDPVMPIRMTVASGHGIGKGVMTAMLTSFLMSTRVNAIGTVTANSYPQLETKTWASITKWNKYSITGHWFTMTGDRMFRVGAREQWYVAAMSCADENSQAFAGQHNVNSTSFYLVDEGSNVSDLIYEVADGGLTDGEPMMFVFGNPTRRQGKFFDINFGTERHRWIHKSIDSRNVEITNKPLLQENLEDWGEDSDRFRVRVRGLPPSASDLQFISTALVGAAQRRKPVVLKSDPLICGLDVSRGGADDCVFRFRRGMDAKSIPPIRISGADARDSTRLEAVAADLLRNGVLLPDSGEELPFGITEGYPRGQRRLRIDMMFIDGTGVGGPICDHMKAAGFDDRVVEIQFGWEAPNLKGYEQCGNMRSWMWELMRKWLERGSIDDTSDLEMDLTAPMFHYNAKNELVLEAKDAIKKRLKSATSSSGKGGSPDDADALALTFARPVSPKKRHQIEQEDVGEEESEFGYLGGNYPNKARIWG